MYALGARPALRIEALPPCACDGAERRDVEAIGFRNYLRAHPEEAATYARLKRRLAAEHPSDREAYTDAKSAYVETVMRKAIK